MPSWNPFIIFSLFFILTACSGGSSPSDSPKIGEIYTDIYHEHSSFYDKWNMTPNRTIRFTVSVNITDPQGVENLKDVYIEDQNNWYWNLLGGPDNLSLDECYYESNDIFKCRFYSSSQLDSIMLKNWELVAEDIQGNVTRKSFNFLLPGGDQLDDELFVYSSEYTGSTGEGVLALEAMSITNNNMVFTSSPGTQSFHIEFETTDNRAKHYGFAFYEGSSELDYIGDTCLCSPSIESKPITLGQKVTMDLPWSEIDFDQGYDASDIQGLHIKLYDSPVDWGITNGTDSWFNYISHSEFITLVP